MKASQEALDQLCADMEDVMARIERSGIQGDLGPVLGEPQDASYWFDQPGSPRAALATTDEEPITIDYDELIAPWSN